MQLSPDCFGEAIELLSAQEQEILNNFRHPIKRMEWATTRILLKFAYLLGQGDVSSQRWSVVSWTDVSNYCSRVQYREIEVLKEGGLDGPPMVFDRTLGTRHSGVSISHKWPFVSVGISSCDERVGVDIEEITVFSEDFQQFYFKSELEVLAKIKVRSGIDMNRLQTLLWTLKEAFFKACPVRGVNIEDIAISLRGIPFVVREQPERHSFQQEVVCLDIGWNGVWIEGTAKLISNSQIMGCLLLPSMEMTSGIFVDKIFIKGKASIDTKPKIVNADAMRSR